ncbi:MAG: RraA family protein [Alphaproteobacteria bacterium]|jgi:regulator of RNase E activity RraA
MDTPLTKAELDALRALDTPTVCNALEEIDFKFRHSGFTTEQLVCPFPDLPPIVGYARTATMRSVFPGAVTDAAAAEFRINYYAYVHQGDEPKISVIQDIDGGGRGNGAFWGEVNSNVHKALGCHGVVTDGCIRDIPDWAEGFQALAGSIKPSHAHVHAVDYGCQVMISGMIVNHGDLIHADQHGAVVIPLDVAREVPAAAARIAAKEKITLDIVKSPDFTFEKLREAMMGPKDIH